MALECNLSGTLQKKILPIVTTVTDSGLTGYPIHKKLIIQCLVGYAGKEQESSCNPNK